MSRLTHLVILSVLTIGSQTGQAVSQELEQKAKFGIWSVVCAKAGEPQCSVVASVHGNADPEVWSRIGLFTSGNELLMLVRTPRLSNLRDGISVGFDGKQFGQAFLDRCDLSFCESEISVGLELRNLIGTKDKLTIQYPTSEKESAAIAFDLDGVVAALGKLRVQPGELPPAIASIEEFHNAASNPSAAVGEWLIRLERRNLPRVESLKAADTTWSQPLNICGNIPATKDVRVNSQGDIVDSTELAQWATNSAKCSKVLVWVIPKSGLESVSTPPALDRKYLALYRVYGAVKDTIPQAVISLDDKKRVPLHAFTSSTLSASVSFERKSIK